MNKEKMKIFLGAPFYDFMDHRENVMQGDKRSLIRILIETVRHKGFELYNAHEREEWGKDWYGPEQCTPLDYEAISRSDIFMAMPGNPPSGGVHIELGWASAQGKPIILLLEAGKYYSNLVHGLPTITPVKIVYYGNPEELLEKVDVLLDNDALFQPS